MSIGITLVADATRSSAGRSLASHDPRMTVDDSAASESIPTAIAGLAMFSARLAPLHWV